MPSTLSPSREAVQAAVKVMGSYLDRLTRGTDVFVATDMLTAAYAIDVVPIAENLIEAVRQLQQAAAEVLLAAPRKAMVFNGEAGFLVQGAALKRLGDVIDRVEVLIRSAEPIND